METVREPHVAACDELRLRAGARRLLEQRLGLRERRLVAHRCKQVAGLAEGLLGSRPAEGAQAAALAEEGVGALGTFPTPASARPLRRRGLPRRRGRWRARRVGRGRRRGRARRAGTRLEPVGEPLGERGVVSGERSRTIAASLSRSRATRGRPLSARARRAGRTPARPPLPRARRRRPRVRQTISAAPKARAPRSADPPRRALPARRGRGGPRARPSDARSAQTSPPRASATAASRPAAGAPARVGRALPAGGGSCSSSADAGSARPRCSQKAIPSSKAASARAGPWSG